MTNRPPPQLFLSCFTCFVVVSSSPRRKQFLTTYRPQLLADGTGWPCSRSRLISLRIRCFPPLAQVEKLVSLFCCVHPSQVFSIAFFFTIARSIFCTISLANRGHRISCSSPVPSLSRANKKVLCRAAQNKKRMVTCGPLFSPSPTALESD